MARDPRLRFHLQPEGALWYHFDAANSHLLIDPQIAERARAPGFARPIELWRAPRWKHPPSVNVIRYPEADGDPAPRTRSEPDADEPPGPGEVVNRSSVVDFVSDVSTFRLGALGLLIDAVSAALAGGPTVVLAAPDADQGALWIGAVSFFASPETCLRLSFSTHERWDDVLAQLIQDRSGPGPDDRARQGARGGDSEVDGWRQPVLCIVPESDIDELTRDDNLPVTVVDPRVEPTLQAVDGVEFRRNHLGQEMPVTDWSRRALAACVEDYAALERTLEQLDSDESGPPDLFVEPAAGSVAEAAWDRLQAALADVPVRADAVQIAFENYLRLALDDEQWLLRRALPLPGASLELADPGLANRLRAPLTRLVHRLTGEPAIAIDNPDDDHPDDGSGETDETDPTDDVHHPDGSYETDETDPTDDVHHPDGSGETDETDPTDDVHQWIVDRPDPPGGDDVTGDLAGDVRRGVQLLRGVDLAHRISRLVGGPDPAAVGIGRLADRAAELLLDPTAGPRVAETVGALDGAALACWIVPPLVKETEPWLRSSHPAGERLPAPVIALLSGAVDAARLIRSARTDPLSAEPVALEVAVATASGRVAGDPQLRGPAVEYLLHQAARTYPDADPGPMVAEAFARLHPDEPWSAAALLRLVERGPTALGPELVAVVLRYLPDWAGDKDSDRLAVVLLKQTEFPPRPGPDGRNRPRRAGITDEQAQLLNLLAASGTERLVADDGLHRQAAEILMWGERTWAGLDPEVRRLIAPRITVAAFQVALAAEPDLAGTALAARLTAVPLGSTWRSAVTTGLEAALPMLAEVLRLNRYRLTGELVVATTRGLLNSVPDLVIDASGELAPDRPRVNMLPVRLVIHWLVRQEQVPELAGHLAALVEQELHAHVGPGNRTDVIAFWRPALLDVPFRASGPTGPVLPPSVLDEVLQVAFGFGDRAGRPVRMGGLAGLLPWPGRRPARAGSDPQPDPGPDPEADFETGPASSDPRPRPRWWPRWW